MYLDTSTFRIFLFQCGDNQVLGSLQKGSLDVMGAVVDIKRTGFANLGYLLRIQNPNMCTTFEVAAETYEDADDWMKSIIETAQNASVRVCARIYHLM